MKNKVLVSAVVFLSLVPGFVLAQPLDCCQIKRALEFEEVLYNESIWVGETTCDKANISTDCPVTGNVVTNCYTSKWGILCFLNTIVVITDWMFYVLLIVSSLFVIYGGFSIATAGGDPSKVGTGRNYILYAMVGLVIGLLSRAIPSVVQGLI